ncbi:MAG: SPFH domain-containing protein [Coriobacteriia bacterium]|nr:SPFH domain-containing protein [Coriobacteriia bacterium]
MPLILEQLSNLVGIVFFAIFFCILAIIALVFFKRFYKVASANEALVISGGRRAKPQVIIAGGRFVSPLKKCVTFPLNVMTIRSDEQETQSSSMVPIIVQWTAQLRADTTNEETLEQAVIGFLGSSENDIRDSLKQTLDGEVRAVLGLMTPEDVVRNKADLSTKVSDNVNDRMKELGFILISLNIAEVTDRNNHYHNLGAEEREGRRREAENITAEAELSIAETKASTEKAASFADLKRIEDVAERQRDVDLKQAGYKAEVDQAQTDAVYAGQVREQVRLTDLATQQGAVAVEREKQSQAAAEARREVVTTEAETARMKLVIEAEAAKEQTEIEAAAKAAIAQTLAAGEAEAAKEQARGDADAIKARAEAEAEQIRKTGQANADAEEALGKARAAATLAEGQAKAEAERLMAEALAANDAVNLQVTLAEIESKTRIEVSTAIATAVAEVGTNTTIIDMGSGGSASDADLLTRFLGSLPETLKRMEVKNEALNGKSIASTVNELSTALLNTEPIIGTPSDPNASLGGEDPGPLPVEATNDASQDISEEAGQEAAQPASEEASGEEATSQEDYAQLDVAPDEEAQIPLLASDSLSDSLPGPEDPAPSDSLYIPNTDPTSIPGQAAGLGTSLDAAYLPPVGAPLDISIADMPAYNPGLSGGEAGPFDSYAANTADDYINETLVLQQISEYNEGQDGFLFDEGPDVLDEAVPTRLPDVINALGLTAEESEEITYIVNSIADSGLISESELYDLAGVTVTTIRQLRENGQPVNAKSIARLLIDADQDGKVKIRDLIASARRARQVAGRIRNRNR